MRQVPARGGIEDRNVPERIDACRRGDRGALEALFRVEAPILERLLVRLVGPGADVEDLLQNTLIAATEGFPRFRGEASVRTWLARIAVHVAHGYLRQPERRRRVPLELVPSDPPDGAALPDSVADSNRQFARIHHHLDRIRPKNRIAFILHVLDGRSIDEVAAFMGASVTATKSRVFLARRALIGRIRKDPALRELLEWERES